MVGGENPSNLGACAHFLGMSGVAFAVFYGCWMKAHYDKLQPPFKTLVLHHNGAVSHDGGNLYNVSTDTFSKTLRDFTGSADHAGADTPRYAYSKHSSTHFLDTDGRRHSHARGEHRFHFRVTDPTRRRYPARLQCHRKTPDGLFKGGGRREPVGRAPSPPLHLACGL